MQQQQQQPRRGRCVVLGVMFSLYDSNSSNYRREQRFFVRQTVINYYLHSFMFVHVVHHVSAAAVPYPPDYTTSNLHQSTAAAVSLCCCAKTDGEAVVAMPSSLAHLYSLSLSHTQHRHLPPNTRRPFVIVYCWRPWHLHVQCMYVGLDYCHCFTGK